MSNILKIVCAVIMYCSCLIGVRQGLLPKNSEILGLVFLSGFLCFGDSITAFAREKDVKTGLVYLLSGFALIAAGLYFVFLY